MVGLSVGEKHFIQAGIAQDLRCDGRRRLAYRPLYVETGIIPQANGSARVRMGEVTDVIASVKKNCLLGGNSGAGKICWDLYIDGLVVGADGNVLDASGAAIKAALAKTGIPKVHISAAASDCENPEVEVSDEEFLQFDTSGIPVKFGRHCIVDATTEEESQMSSAVSISINKKGHICGLTKRGGAGLDASVILDMSSGAKYVSEQFMNKLDSEIAAAEASEAE